MDIKHLVSQLTDSNHNNRYAVAKKLHNIITEAGKTSKLRADDNSHDRWFLHNQVSIVAATHNGEEELWVTEFDDTRRKERVLVSLNSQGEPWLYASRPSGLYRRKNLFVLHNLPTYWQDEMGTHDEQFVISPDDTVYLFRRSQTGRTHYALEVRVAFTDGKVLGCVVNPDTIKEDWDWQYEEVDLALSKVYKTSDNAEEIYWKYVERHSYSAPAGGYWTIKYDPIDLEELANQIALLVQESSIVQEQTAGEISLSENTYNDYYDLIIDKLGVSNFDNRGFSELTVCPFGNHAHDNTNPAFSWNKETRVGYCQKCAKSYMAKEVSKALGISWNDYVNVDDDFVSDEPILTKLREINTFANE